MDYTADCSQKQAEASAPAPDVLNYFTGSVNRHSAMMLAATTISGLAGFVYKVVMSRMLSLEDFSAFYTLLNFFTIFSVPAVTVEMAVSRLASVLRAAGSQNKIFPMLENTAKKVSLVAFSGAALFLPAVFPASRLLHLPGPGPVVVTLLALLLFLPLNIGYGAVQGLQKFRWWGVILIAVSLTRLAAGTAFVSLGYGVNGAIGASLVAIGGGILLFVFPLKGLERENPGSSSPPLRISGLAGIFSALLLMTYLAFGDMLLVKYFFSPSAAAVYGASSILGRGVFYIGLPVSMALFPKVCFARACGVSPLPILLKSMALFLLLSSSLSLLFFLMPEFAAGILFTEDYSAAAGLIKYFGFAFLPAGICLLLVQYNLALRRRKFIPRLLITAVIHFLLIFFFNEHPGQVLAAIAASGTIGAALLGLCSRGRE